VGVCEGKMDNAPLHAVVGCQEAFVHSRFASAVSRPQWYNCNYSSARRHCEWPIWIQWRARLVVSPSAADSSALAAPSPLPLAANVGVRLWGANRCVWTVRERPSGRIGILKAYPRPIVSRDCRGRADFLGSPILGDDGGAAEPRAREPEGGADPRCFFDN
jgi:hypothetical protein